MRSILLATVAYLCCYSAFTATPTPTTTGGTACTAATDPWGTTRCPLAGCKKYYDSANTVDLTGYYCATAGTGYFTVSTLNAGIDTTGNTNDYVCVNNCANPGGNYVPCDTTGLLCTACATGFAASGKTPSATSQQPCNCVVAADKTQTCPTCAHGYYGTDANNVGVTPAGVDGTTDATYSLNFAGTLPAKCVACPTTLTNCAQCATATTCAKCTAASGNTPSSSGSCSAAKIIASVAFVFAGLLALLF